MAEASQACTWSSISTTHCISEQLWFPLLRPCQALTSFLSGSWGASPPPWQVSSCVSPCAITVSPTHKQTQISTDHPPTHQPTPAEDAQGHHALTTAADTIWPAGMRGAAGWTGLGITTSRGGVPPLEGSDCPHAHKTWDFLCIPACMCTACR